jgi:hypothetical protein
MALETGPDLIGEREQKVRPRVEGKYTQRCSDCCRPKRYFQGHFKLLAEVCQPVQRV